MRSVSPATLFSSEMRAARTAHSSKMERGFETHFMSLSARMNSSIARVSLSRSKSCDCSTNRAASSGVISASAERSFPTRRAIIRRRMCAAVSRAKTCASRPSRIALSIRRSASPASDFSSAPTKANMNSRPVVPSTSRTREAETVACA